MNRDITKFNPAGIPTTKEKEEMKILTMSPLELFVDAMNSGEIQSSSIFPVERSRLKAFLRHSTAFDLTSRPFHFVAGYTVPLFHGWFVVLSSIW